MGMSLLCALALALPVPQGSPSPRAVTIFDGTTLSGWESPESDAWRVQDGAITCGDGTRRIPKNTYLCSKRSFGSFELRCQFRLTGDPATGMINSGVQFRSERLADGRVRGYQADLGEPGWWGSLYDEHRRDRVLAQSDMSVVGPALRRGDWNDYVVRCEGPRVRLWINDVLTVDYTELGDSIARTGVIGLQLHSGGAAMVEFRKLELEEIEWRESPLSPEEQLTRFEVPEGFYVELVASEATGLAKPVTVCFDDSGRMWSMTATEYPVDANENAGAAAELWRSGGADRVVVFDYPDRPGPHQARTFVDGLAMPMGLLPWGDGAIVGHGPEVRYYRDDDGDGRADRHDVLLSGFGVQDSHLLPHQFTYGPGGWVYMAQGAFNHSAVTAGAQGPVPFDFCKLGRFRVDGSAFEIAGVGFNNIWGLVIGRRGEMFIQEANDMGYSVVPFRAGSSFPGIGNQKFKPYAPLVPSSCDFRLGGTGLSGLAFSDDMSNAYPYPWHEVMFIANPITRTINAARIDRDAHGVDRVTQLPDFLTSRDDWFRPIALTFGPDGCLYIVDWYNKIISHNEVRRDHPDRDKTRGRIWRVRHRSQQRRAVRNVAAASDRVLLDHLGSPSTWVMRAAWHQIVQRRALALAPDLVRIAGGRSGAAIDTRIHALWALEGLGHFDPELMRALVGDAEDDVRREAVRALSAFPAMSAQWAPWLQALVEDVAAPVRAAAIQSLAAIPEPSVDAVELLARFGLGELVAGTLAEVPWDGRHGVPLPAGPVYDRAFERYLVRAALEQHPDRLVEMLSARRADLPAESRLLAALALPVALRGQEFLRAWEQVERDPGPDELLLLVQGAADAELRPVLQRAFAGPERASRLLRLVLSLRARLDLRADGVGVMLALIANTAMQLGDRETEDVIVQLARELRVADLAPVLLGFATAENRGVGQRAAAVAAMGAVGLGAAPEIVAIAGEESAPAPIRNAALTALACTADDRGVDLLAGAWPGIEDTDRDAILFELSGSADGARSILACVDRGAFSESDLSGAVLERMRAVLGDDPAMRLLWDRAARDFTRVLRLGGQPECGVAANITLDGTFTVECWVRLREGVTNADGVLGGRGDADLNFHDSRFRFYGGSGVGDVAIARTPIIPEAWTHVAATRDAGDVIRLYVNGELDATGSSVVSATFSGLDVGVTSPADAGTAGDIGEFRVWSGARTGEQIRAWMSRAVAAGEPVDGLERHFGGEAWVGLNPGSVVVRVAAGPRLMTGEQVDAQQRTIDRFALVASRGGDGDRGRALFAARCLVCHTLGDQGVGAAPPLDGSARRELDSLLRALVTPNAAVEGGYRVFRVQTHDGRLVEGCLASRDDAGVTLRFMGGAEMHIPTRDIRSARYLDQSFMTPGILESMSEQQVADLLAYVGTLK